MDIKLLVFLIAYWSIWGLIFIASGLNPDGDVLSDGNLTATVDMGNLTQGLQGDETSTGGIFSFGISLARFFGFVLFGIGLVGAPVWFASLFVAWQSFVTIIGAGFIISSIWNG